MLRCTKCGTIINSNTDCQNCGRKWAKNKYSFLFPINKETCSELKIQSAAPATEYHSGSNVAATSNVTVTTTAAMSTNEAEVPFTPATSTVQEQTLNQQTVQQAEKNQISESAQGEKIIANQSHLDGLAFQGRSLITYRIARIYAFLCFFIGGVVPIHYLSLLPDYASDKRFCAAIIGYVVFFMLFSVVAVHAFWGDVYIYTHPFMNIPAPKSINLSMLVFGIAYPTVFVIAFVLPEFITKQYSFPSLFAFLLFIMSLFLSMLFSSGGVLVLLVFWTIFRFWSHYLWFADVEKLKNTFPPNKWFPAYTIPFIFNPTILAIICFALYIALVAYLASVSKNGKISELLNLLTHRKQQQ